MSAQKSAFFTIQPFYLASSCTPGTSPKVKYLIITFHPLNVIFTVVLYRVHPDDRSPKKKTILLRALSSQELSVNGELFDN